MQKIDSLLKQVVSQKDDRATIMQCVFSVTGIQLEKTHIVCSQYRDIQKVQLIVRGSQKTKIILVKDVLEKQLHTLGFTLVL